MINIGWETPQPCRGPLPTRPPRIRPPAGAWDTHAHVVGPAPWVTPRNYDPQPVGLEDYLRMLDTLGFARGVLVQVSVHGTDNARLLEALDAQPQRLRGVVALAAEAPLEDLRRLHDAGVRGVRILTLVRGGVTSDAAVALARRIAPLGWHVEFGIPGAELPGMEAMLAELPTPVVLAHFGGCRPEDPGRESEHAALLRFLEKPDRYVKLSGVYRVASEPYAEFAPLARRLASHAPDRLLFGSDWPHVAIGLDEPMPTTEGLYDAFCDWLPDPDVRRTILVDTPARLYG
jgi:predicted TIM-barrel fold metal-dependent hydrolase